MSENQIVRALKDGAITHQSSLEALVLNLKKLQPPVSLEPADKADYLYRLSDLLAPIRAEIDLFFDAQSDLLKQQPTSVEHRIEYVQSA